MMKEELDKDDDPDGRTSSGSDSRLRGCFFDSHSKEWMEEEVPLNDVIGGGGEWKARAGMGIAHRFAAAMYNTNK
jgi:hypothetical protein